MKILILSDEEFNEIQNALTCSSAENAQLDAQVCDKLNEQLNAPISISIATDMIWGLLINAKKENPLLIKELSQLTGYEGVAKLLY